MFTSHWAPLNFFPVMEDNGRWLNKSKTLFEMFPESRDGEEEILILIDH